MGTRRGARRTRTGYELFFIALLFVLVATMVALTVVGASKEAHFDFEFVIAAFAGVASAALGTFGLLKNSEK